LTFQWGDNEEASGSKRPSAPSNIMNIKVGDGAGHDFLSLIINGMMD
jgi:hypothetical protein